MLTRIKLRKDFRIVVRLLSDKPSDQDGKIPPVKEVEDRTNAAFDKASTDKINSILKSMINDSNTPSQDFKFVPPREKPKKIETSKEQNEKLEENITVAAGEVAKAIGGDVKHTESELLSKVLGKINQTPMELRKLLTDMKVNRGSKENEDDYQPETRGQQVRRMVERSRDSSQHGRPPMRRPTQQYRDQNEQRSPVQMTTIDIFSGKPTNIFSKATTNNFGTRLDVWEALEQRELTLATAQPPANYFQKMILWTEQGKVWKFPINNEQGLEEEEKVHFSEHVFLDSHLEGWCPTKGPIRHFMELVCIGLSKNAFYTVQEKKDHIQWYREYFESKHDLLKEVGAWVVENENEEKLVS